MPKTVHGPTDVTVDLTTDVTGLLPDSNLAAVTTANKVNTSAIYGTAYLPDDTVDTTALKTAIGEVSDSTGGWAHYTLPGGEYGFYPQLKAADGTSHTFGAEIFHETNASFSTSYVSRISLYGYSTVAFYAQQRYVTASGQDLWIFLQVDKVTGKILSSWQAMDHPSYGNGGDPDKIPHPFGSYNADKHEVILLDKGSCNTLIVKAGETGKSILTLVNEDYKPNMSRVEIYEPLHSGKFLGKAPVVISSIPDYIKVRELLSLTPEDRIARDTKKQIDDLDRADAKIIKQLAIDKLKLKLKLSNEEWGLIANG